MYVYVLKLKTKQKNKQNMKRKKAKQKKMYKNSFGQILKKQKKTESAKE